MSELEAGTIVTTVVTPSLDFPEHTVPSVVPEEVPLPSESSTTNEVQEPEAASQELTVAQEVTDAKEAKPTEKAVENKVDISSSPDVDKSEERKTAENEEIKKEVEEEDEKSDVKSEPITAVTESSLASQAPDTSTNITETAEPVEIKAEEGKKEEEVVSDVAPPPPAKEEVISPSEEKALPQTPTVIPGNEDKPLATKEETAPGSTPVSTTESPRPEVAGGSSEENKTEDKKVKKKNFWKQLKNLFNFSK
ncbi:hypothetical protein G9A89_021072 [Geosiphon pyriformis]|nr:hypothetical protein G9A89_021072 [Geosiphon pyriformis]